MQIAQELLDQIVEHARRDAPNECCGLVITRDATALSVEELENTEASPLRFQVDGKELLRALNAAEDAGNAIGAIYHSHTRSRPYPSQTDITFAANWPGVEWLIVGLNGGEPEVRSYRIDGPTVTEVDVDVVG